MDDQWRPKFLWLPRRVEGRWKWLTWIEVCTSPMEPFEERQRLR